MPGLSFVGLVSSRQRGLRSGSRTPRRSREAAASGGDMTAKKWADIRAKRFTPEGLNQIDQEVESELLEMDLQALREAVGLTQGELAQRVAITQSQLSKMERREDHRISTLRRYIEALGGKPERPAKRAISPCAVRWTTHRPQRTSREPTAMSTGTWPST